MAKFRKGQSGNPAGKPKGTPDKRTALRELIQPHAPELVAKALELAKLGDVTALRMLLDRCMAPLRARSEPAPFALGESATPTDTARAVVQAIAAGAIAPDVGAQILGSLQALAKITETDELAARVAALEKAHDARPTH